MSWLPLEIGCGSCALFNTLHIALLNFEYLNASSWVYFMISPLTREYVVMSPGLGNSYRSCVGWSLWKIIGFGSYQD
jgi:hypothetical protein